MFWASFQAGFRLNLRGLGSLGLGKKKFTIKGTGAKCLGSLFPLVSQHRHNSICKSFIIIFNFVHGNPQERVPPYIT